ncbi:MAG: hypothetical protein V4683_08455 [Bacteroidota bacterium]
MKTFSLLTSFIIVTIIHIKISAQVGINANNALPNNTAMLDVSSGNKGFLMPRMDFAARNGIITPATGLMLFNTSTNVFDFYNGSSWLSLGATSNTLWNSSGTSIYNLNSSNVGIGLSTPTQAKLVVNGDVNGQTALFKSVSGISIDGSNKPNIGFNSDNNYPIIAGAGAIFSFNPVTNGGSAGTLNLDFYKTKTVGTLFSSPKNILKFQDFTSLGFGYWLDLNNFPDSRINVSDEMYSKSNDNLNLIPLGAIYFKFTDLQNGDNATRIIRNVGNTANLYVGLDYVDSFIDSGGSIYEVSLNLNTNSKDYDEIFLVGSPNFINIQNATASSWAAIYRTTTTYDKISIIYSNSGSFTDYMRVTGTLLVYGIKN